MLLIGNTSSYSQKIICGRIIDSETKQSLQYVNIGIKDKGIGTVSLKNGAFTLKLNSELNNFDTLLISVIGYNSKKVSINQLKKDTSEIFLMPQIYNIQEIIIKPIERKIVGSISKSKRMYAYFYSNVALGGEIGSIIEFHNYPCKIEDISFNNISNDWDSIKCRIHMYKLNDNNPISDLVKQNIYFTINSQKGKMTFDLSKYNLVADEKILVTFELLETFGKNDRIIKISAAKSESLYSRFISQDKWKTFKGVHIGYETTISF